MKIIHQDSEHVKFSLIGLVITMGIVYGDIGTSPLYVMNAIVDSKNHGVDFITGAISCVIWTLTCQTTIKYVLITLRANNKGEGGIFALYALLRKKKKYLFIFALIGGATLLADGVITPSITVTSAIEGLKISNPGIPVIPIVMTIITILFLIQQFGTDLLGKSFGPIMLIWFTVICILGIKELVYYPQIIKAFNPYYVYAFLTEFPEGFILLGSVFLCTTGAEALYSDLGHCGLKNIRISWLYVKACLIINYLGQGAWILTHQDQITDSLNPFFAIMPHWFLFIGIILATIASVIASQALISGSFTLISEAIQLNFWPKLRVNHPTHVKGQMYIPFINWLLYVLCIFVVLFFQDSTQMEAAYGLAITITMIMTTVLVTFHLKINKKRSLPVLIFFITFFFIIEISFLVANFNKFFHGGWFTILLSSCFGLVMFVWYRTREIKKKYLQFMKFDEKAEVISDLQKDNQIPKFTSNLVYLTKADSIVDVESKIIYSILNKFPKRADKYWLLHVHYTDEPSTLQYTVTQLIPNVVFRVDFHIGFKISPKINIFFRKVIDDLLANKEIDMVSTYPSLKKHKIFGDFKFVLIDRIHTHDFELKIWDKLIMNIHELVNKISISESKAFGLDTSVVIDEKVPLMVHRKSETNLQRVYE